MDSIDVVFASDNNYAQHVAVAGASLLLNSEYPEKINIYILNDTISSENCRRIEKTITCLRGNVTFISVDTKQISGFVSGHLSKAAYLRLLIPSLLPENITKAIYFDTDLVVLDDVQKLWEISLQGKPLGAVCDYGIMASKRMVKQKFETLGLPEGDTYFNSGMLVMDLVQWRSFEYDRKVVECILQNQFRHHDQDALNKVFLHNWYELPLRWNVIPPVFSLPLKVLLRHNMRSEAIKALKNPAVFHWAGRYKPWEFSLNKDFNMQYYQYFNSTSFSDNSMPKPSKDMTGKSVRRQAFRIKLAKLWGHIF